MSHSRQCYRIDAAPAVRIGPCESSCTPPPPALCTGKASCLGDISKPCCHHCHGICKGSCCPSWMCMRLLVAEAVNSITNNNSGMVLSSMTSGNSGMGCVQAAEGGTVHPAQLEEVAGAQGLPAVPPQGRAPAVRLALQAGSPRSTQEARLPERSWQAAAGSYPYP